MASLPSSSLIQEMELDHERESIISVDCQTNAIAILYSSGELLVKSVGEFLESSMNDSRDMQTHSFRFSKWIKNPYKVFLHPSGQHLIVTTTNGFLHFFTVAEPTLCCAIELSSEALRQRTFIGESLFWINPQQCDGTIEKTTKRGAKPSLVVLVGIAKMGLCFEVSFEFLPRSIKPTCALLTSLSEGKNSATIKSIFYACFSKCRTLILTTATELFHVSVPVEENEDSLSFLEDIRQKNYRLNRVFASRSEGSLQKSPSALLSSAKPNENSSFCGSLGTYTPMWSSSDPRSFCWSNNEGIIHGLFQRSENMNFYCKLEHIDGIGHEELTSPWRADAIKSVVPTASHLLVLLQARLLVIPHPAGVPWCRNLMKDEPVSEGKKRVGELLSPSLQEVLSTTVLDSSSDGNLLSAAIQEIIYNVRLHRVFVRSIDRVWELTLCEDFHQQWKLYISCAANRLQDDALRVRFFTAATKAASTAEEINTVYFLNGFYTLSHGKENEGFEMLSKCDWFLGILQRLGSDSALCRSFLTKRLVRLASLHQKTASSLIEENLRQVGYVAIRWSMKKQSDDNEGLVNSFIDLVYSNCSFLCSDPQFSDTVANMLLFANLHDSVLHLYKKTKNFATVLSYQIDHNQHSAAVETLALRDPKDEKWATLWHIYLPKLISVAPVKLLGVLRRFIAKAHRSRVVLDLDPLLPAFLNYSMEHNEIPNQVHQVKLLLNSSIYKYENESAVMHDYYLFLLAEEGDLDRLKIHLEHSKKYELIFAVQVCLKYKRMDCMPILYKRLGFASDTVKKDVSSSLLQNDGKIDIDTKELDEFQQQFIWKNILHSQLDSHGPLEALKVVQKSKGTLTLHDLLLEVKDDSAAVESLKDVICHQLDEYSNMSLNHSALYAKTLQAISVSKYQLHEVQQQVSCISSSQKCFLCGTALLGQTSRCDPYLVYPSCKHAVHESCAVEKIKPIGLAAFLSTNLADFCSSLEEVAARDCVICGEAAILEVALPLV